MTIPFRPRFAARRLLHPGYYRRLAAVLAHPLRFDWVLLRKILPSSSKKPVDLTLKDGKVIRVEEFWTLFLFDEIFVEQCYEPAALVQQGPFSTIVDVGANIGLYVLRMKQLWPKARVLAIEPHPHNFERLVGHMEANHLDDVRPLQIGLSERCGCMDLYLSPRNIAGHSMYKKTDLPPISVPVFTLEQVLRENQVSGGGILLKLDCEGCEHAVLSSLTPETASRISCIIFEPERSLYDLDALLEKVRSLGFTISWVADLVLAVRTAPPASAGDAGSIRQAEATFSPRS